MRRRRQKASSSPPAALTSTLVSTFHLIPPPLPLLTLIAEVLSPRCHQTAQLVGQVGKGNGHSRGEEVEETEGQATYEEEDETSKDPASSGQALHCSGSALTSELFRTDYGACQPNEGSESRKSFDLLQ